jgi:hypothetical protein
MQIGLGIFYVTDENISPHFAKALSVTGFDVRSIVDVPGCGRGISDEKIIEWLSVEGGRNAVWVTKDWEAQKVHAKLIHEKHIPVLWLFIPQKGLRALRELQLLASVIEFVNDTINVSAAPVYLCASFTGAKPRLEQIVNPLTSGQIICKKIPLSKPIGGKPAGDTLTDTP